MAVASDKASRVTLCEAFLSFKSLLLLIYQLMSHFFNKLSGHETVALDITMKPRPASVIGGWMNNNDDKMDSGLKEISEIPGPRPLPFFGTLLTSAALKSTDLVKANEEREKQYGSIVKEEYFWNYPLIMVLGAEEIKKIKRMNPIMRSGMDILIQYRNLKPDRYNTMGLVNSFFLHRAWDQDGFRREQKSHSREIVAILKLPAVSKEELTKNDLNVVILELITGATEPVYHAVIITLYWISKYEHVYNRVLEELREQMPTKDSPVDECVLQNIPYLKACVMETFRICPTTVNVARIMEKEMELGGYRLPAYTTVILQSWHACLQDTNFYRAKEYLPERWLLQNGVPPFRPHDRQVMCNFGLGTRACPGRRIATQLINIFLCKVINHLKENISHVLRKFRVKFTKDIDLRYEWLLVVKEPVIAEFCEHET